MGLFSTSLNLYKNDQDEIIDALKREMEERGLSKFDRIIVNNNNFHEILHAQVSSTLGIFYLVAERSNNWTTIVELAPNIEEPFYLNDIGEGMSLKLNTYALSFSLHDGDVLFYTLEFAGELVDGYNSNVQYFAEEPLKEDEIRDLRHDATKLSKFLPQGKTIDGLLEILNRGYWDAFDHEDLDSDGIPNDDKYFIDEADRLTELGRYLEIYSAEEFPFTFWYDDLLKLDLTKCYLVKATQ